MRGRRKFSEKKLNRQKNAEKSDSVYCRVSPWRGRSTGTVLLFQQQAVKQKNRPRVSVAKCGYRTMTLRPPVM